MKKTGWILLCFSLLPFSLFFAQQDTTWFNAVWEPVQKSANPEFYRIAQDSSDQFFIRSYYAARNRIYQVGMASSLSPLRWEGQVDTYRPTRKRKLKTEHFEKGVLHGISTEYYAREQKHIVREYNQGEVVWMETYFPHGGKMLEIREGGMKKWDRTGALIEEFDPQKGQYSIWNPAGDLMAQGGGKDYLTRHGAWKFYQPGLVVLSEGTYTDDHKTGTWKYYSNSGALSHSFDEKAPCGAIDEALAEFLTLPAPDSTQPAPKRKKAWPGEKKPEPGNILILHTAKAHHPSGHQQYLYQLDLFRHCSQYYDFWEEAEMDTSMEGMTEGTSFTSQFYGSLEETQGLLVVKLYLVDLDSSKEQFLVLELVKR